MKKYSLIAVIMLLFLFPGCCKTNDNVIYGLEELKVAAEKLSTCNSELITDYLKDLKKRKESATTEEEKTFVEKEIETAESNLRANNKLPLAIEKLLKALRN